MREKTITTQFTTIIPATTHRGEHTRIVLEPGKGYTLEPERIPEGYIYLLYAGGKAPVILKPALIDTVFEEV